MGFRGWQTCALFFSFIPTLALANDWYSEIAAIFEKGAPPKVENIGGENAWVGKCATSGARSARIPSVLYVHVDRDPLSGPLYQVVQLFEPTQLASLEKTRIAARALLLHADNLGAGLKHSENAKAWVMKLGGPSSYQNLLLRQWSPSGKDPVIVVHASSDNNAGAYCYYYQPLAE